MRELADQIKEEQSDRTSFFLDDSDARMYEEADGLMSKIDALTGREKRGWEGRVGG